MAEEALRSTSVKANFHRLTRLLMRGGVQLLRETLDFIHSPADLPLRLADPAIQSKLRGAGLTRPERVCLYPSSGLYGKSNDFDITLIFKLFRTICGLIPPPGPRGWDDLPNGSDHTLVADLVRIKYYRNEIYGHCPTMEISDIDFIRLWREISEALLRIATNISSAKRDEWEKSIDDLLRNPLTPDEERCIEELETWYKQDMDVKDELVKLREELRSLKAALVVIQMDVAGEHRAAGSEPTFPEPKPSLPEPEQEAGSDDLEPNNPPDIDVWDVILSFKGSVNLFLRYLRCKLHLLVRNYEVGSWHITVECSSLQVLAGLWEDYRSGHLNSVAQEMLITPQVLQKLSLTELKLKTFISEDQWEKGKGLLEASSGAEDKSEIQSASQATITKAVSEGSIKPGATKRTLPEAVRKAVRGEPFDPISDGGIVQDQEPITIPQEKITKRIIFSEVVSEKGFTWILKETGVLIKFFPKAVPDPRLVTCSLWKPGIVSPLLENNESLVSNVIELDCDDPHDVVFSSIEVALSHSAICLRGYELVLKEMTDSEGLHWKDLRTSEVQPSELQDVCSRWKSELPFVKAKITRFSRYAVICRLKDYKLPKEDSEERSELTINVPDFPDFCLSIPGTSFPSSMDLVVKVQELSPNGFKGKRVLVGPVVHITFTPEVKLRDPSQVSLTCPILLKVPIDPQQHQIKLSGMTSRHVRVFFRGGKDTSRKWVDWSKKLKGTPKLEEGIVAFEVDGTETFQTNRLLECGVILDSSTEPLDAEELFNVEFSCPQHVGFFAFFCREEKQQRQDLKQGSLTLCCFPLHMKTELTKELSSEHGVLLYGEAESARQLAKGDQTLFSLSNGLTSVDEGIDTNYTPVVFTGDIFKGSFSVRFDEPTVDFFKMVNDREGRERLCSLRLHPVEPFKDRSSGIFREIPQSEEGSPVCKPSTSVESLVDDSAQIGKLRKSVVTQRSATLFKDEIGNCWKDLGTFLGVHESILRNIEMDYDRVREKGGAVLQSWRDKEGSRATVGRLESVLIAMEKKRIAEKLLEIARKETCNSTEEEGVTRQHQASEREGSPEKMLSTAEEVFVPRTRHKKQSGRRDEGGSERRNTDELKRVEQLEKVRKSNWLKRKSKVDKLPKRQQNTRRNKPFEMLRHLLMEVAELKEAIEENILERKAENGNVEGLRGMIEKVRKVRQDFSGAS